MTLFIENINKYMYVSNKFMKAFVKIINIPNVATKNPWQGHQSVA